MLRWIIKKIFKKKDEEYQMPYVRAVVTLTESAIENGINDDLNRKIIIFQGNEVWKEEPYSKSRVKVLTQVEHIPVHYADEKFEEGEEINPAEVYYEEF